jgi:F-type H+-transporting ATPase subunit gamma
MAKARQLIGRRRTVQNIRTITKTMQMIAASRFRRSYNRVALLRQAVNKVQEVVERVAEMTGWQGHPLLLPGQGNLHALLVVTADRGLAGGYNNHVILAARQAVARLEAQGKQAALYMLGKKGVSHLKHQSSWAPPGQAPLPRPFKTHIGLDDRNSEGFAREASAELMEAFLAGKYAGVEVIYNRMRSGASYEAQAATLLPIAPPDQAAQFGSGGRAVKEEEPLRREQLALFDFMPSPEGVLAAALPMLFRLRLGQCLLEAAVSERMARMMAMSAATKAADDMTKLLTRRINRARQSQITTELAEIISGSDALK